MSFLRRIGVRRDSVPPAAEIEQLIAYVNELNKLLAEAIAVLKIHNQKRAELIAEEFHSLTTKASYDSFWRQGEETDARPGR